LYLTQSVFDAMTKKLFSLKQTRVINNLEGICINLVENPFSIRPTDAIHSIVAETRFYSFIFLQISECKNKRKKEEKKMKKHKLICNCKEKASLIFGGHLEMFTFI